MFFLIFLPSLLLSSVQGLRNIPSTSELLEQWPEEVDLRKPLLKADKMELIRELSPFPLPVEKLGHNICQTEECMDASLALLHSINFTVDPCEDFYEFSCGRWVMENPRPQTSVRWGSFDILRIKVNNITQGILKEPLNAMDVKPLNQAKETYALCMDNATVEKDGLGLVLSIIKANGGWPVLTPWWDASYFDMFGFISKAAREYGDSILFSVSVSQDLKNTNKSVIYLDQGSFFLPRRVLINPQQYNSRLLAYQHYFVGVAKELAAASGVTVSESELIERARQVINFEIRLAQISTADEDRTNTTKNYNPYTLDCYQNLVDATHGWNPRKIPWKCVLDLIFSNSGVHIKANERIIVVEKDYLLNVITILDETDMTTIANYAFWRIVSGMVSETTEAMRDLKFQFDKVNSGLQQPIPRPRRCAAIALNSFGMAIGIRYIQKEFVESAKDNVNLMVDNLRAAFKVLLTQADWMDDATKENALFKLKKMVQDMAYPDWLFNRTRIEKVEYLGLEIVPGCYLKTLLAITRWAQDKQLKELRKETDRTEWLTYPGVVNAFYSPEFNSITFPAGVLQPPFYRIKGPESINYGGIGVVIGHEITHGFDDQGSQFDAYGNAVDWWSNTTLTKFLEKAKCIVDQYGSYETPGGRVNGLLTAGENIADNGGVHQSLNAYHTWIQKQNGGMEEPRLPGLEDLTHEQLFFLGFSNIWCQNATLQSLQNGILTDPHSPAKIRVLGTLQNSEAFSRAWGCSPGSTMNPAKKCALW